MAIPTYDQFIEPLLRFLGMRSDGAKVAQVDSDYFDEVP